MRFIPSIDAPQNPDEPAFWFIYRGNEVIISKQSAFRGIPFFYDIKRSGIQIVRQHYLGSLDWRDCFCAETDYDTAIPDYMTFSPLRPLLEVLGEEMFQIAGRAFQVIDWDRKHQFCSRCGSQLRIKSDERAKTCHSCGLVAYPVIAPAVIVAVVRDDTLLLAHSLRFQAGLYSVLAGFAEAGETLEECVRREVREEVGIGITDINYFGSMPWPFPNSLMVGFTAHHASGEIVVDHSELEDAGWYGIDNLPQHTPVKGTIARKLIDWFIEKYSTG
ncbi:MAG: NAD(+) diphosphatase [Dissulfurispiraceae bacterium]